jgi:hypothetical protein
MPPIHTRILHRFDMTLHIAKNMGYAKEEKIFVPRSIKKRKEKER